VRRPRTALLRRSRRGWVAAVPPRRAPRRSWLRPIAGARRVRVAPVGAILALRPRRTLVRSQSSYALARVTQIVRNVASPVLLRSAGVVYLSATATRTEAVRGTARHRPPRRDARRESPAARAHTRVLVERKLVERLLRAEATSVFRSPVLRGPIGPQGPAGRVLTLVRNSAPLAPAAAAEADELPATAADRLEVSQASSGPASFGAAAPDVEVLALQVLDRIERRAVAQRERMGRI
jgi:hypothetical protein